MSYCTRRGRTATRSGTVCCPWLLIRSWPLASPRDPAAGYNTWVGYAEEDAAQALDELLNLQLSRNTRGGFDPAAGHYADFLDRALADPRLWPADLQARYLELTRAGS